MRVKRVYEPAARADGFRVLVDRVWPRGVSKSTAAIDQWMKDVAPSTGLRQWFGHDPERWTEFRHRYRAELARRPELLKELRTLARKGPLTLVYAARDERHNQAVVLRERLIR